MEPSQFEQLYAETSRGLRSYLRRLMNDSALAEDLAQESYLRMINARLPEDMTAAHRKNYLYRIATNLARDHYKSARSSPLEEPEALAAPASLPDAAYDVQGAFQKLKPRERELLWLAYVECFSHEEIARVAGAKAASIRPMLARARARLAGVLKRRGYAPRRERA